LLLSEEHGYYARQKNPIKGPGAPIEAMGAPICLIALKFVKSAPIRVPSTPQMYAKAKAFSPLGNSAKIIIV